jgi:hypothetical protein
MGAWALVPTLAVGFLGYATRAIVFREMPPPDWLDVAGSVAFAPLAETALMIPVIKLFARAFKTDTHSAAATAILAGVPHGLVLGNAGYVTAWPFFVFTRCFLTWRPSSLKLAYGYTAAVHALYNAVIVALVFASVHELVSPTAQ